MDMDTAVGLTDSTRDPLPLLCVNSPSSPKWSGVEGVVYLPYASLHLPFHLTHLYSSSSSSSNKAIHPWSTSLNMPMHQGFFPREGFCLDVILKLIRNTALNPTILLPLVLLARFTKRGQDLSILHPTAISRLHTLFYVAATRAVSSWFSKKVRNNWVDDKYVWNQEIVVVTGGAGGIGGGVVRAFDELGVKVVVLDIQPMDYHTCKCVPCLAQSGL
jgi:hypothetical protein